MAASFLGGGGLPMTGAQGADPGLVAAKPLFRDPVFDGAADPVVIWNPHVRKWWMFYTNRRANMEGLSGGAWVHGTRIGIAESADSGAHWTHVGVANIEMPQDLGGAEPTEWAPEVVTGPDGLHHLYIAVVPGIFEDWQHPRTISAPHELGSAHVALRPGAQAFVRSRDRPLRAPAA